MQYRKFIWIKVNIGLEGCQSVTDGRDNNELNNNNKKKKCEIEDQEVKKQTLEE